MNSLFNRAINNKAQIIRQAMESNKIRNNTTSMVAPGITWALLLGAAMWGVSWYPMRLLDQAGLSGLWLTLLIYIAAMAASLWKTGPQLRALWQEPRQMLLLALFAGWTNVAFVLAVLDGNIMRVLLLFYLSPLWAVILGYIFLNERLSPVSLVTLVLAMAGAVTMLWHPQMGAPWPSSAADWLAITSGMAFSASNVVVRKAQHINLAAKVGISWLGVIAIAVTLIVWEQQAAPQWHADIIIGAIALGVLGIAVMTTLVQYGVTHMPIHRSAVILLFELVAGAISQQLLTDEVLSMREWVGGTAIIAAAYVSAKYG
ncbi:MAG: DMT family transporter [Proteobacteria bacterium]|nr:DMT family transporter [Pseudomonadota bacterium]